MSRRWKGIALVLFCLVPHAARAQILQSSDFDKMSALTIKTSNLLSKLNLTNTDGFAGENNTKDNSELVNWTLCVNQLRTAVLDVAAVMQLVSTEIAISLKMKDPEDEAAALKFVLIGLSDIDRSLPKWRAVAREANQYCRNETVFNADVGEFLELLGEIEAAATPMKSRVH